MSSCELTIFIDSNYRNPALKTTQTNSIYNLNDYGIGKVASSLRIKNGRVTCYPNPGYEGDAQTYTNDVQLLQPNDSIQSFKFETASFIICFKEANSTCFNLFDEVIDYDITDTTEEDPFKDKHIDKIINNTRDQVVVQLFPEKNMGGTPAVILLKGNTIDHLSDTLTEPVNSIKITTSV